MIEGNKSQSLLAAYDSNPVMARDRTVVKKAIDAFCEFAGCDPPLGSISDEALSQFVQHQRSKGRSLRAALRSKWRIIAVRDHILPPPPDPCASQGTLREYAESASTSYKSRSTWERVQLAVQEFCEFVGHDVAVQDVSPDLIDEFEDSLNPATGKKYSGAIRGLMWRFDPVLFKKRRGSESRNLKPSDPSKWFLLNLYEQEYEPLRLRSRSANTKRLYRNTLKLFDRFLGRFASLDDLCDQVLNDFAAWMLDQGYTKRSVNRELWNLIAIWNWCCDKGIFEVRPDVQLEKAPKRVPLAWTREELMVLMLTIQSLRGRIGELPACNWWSALIHVLWDSGERIGAVTALHWSQVNLIRKWVLFPAEQRKGQAEDNAVKLSEETIIALKRIRAARGGLVFPWPYHSTHLWSKYGEILKLAGLPADRSSKFHRIRKSVGSHVEAAGGNAALVLRHADRRTTETYLDPTIVPRQQPVDILFRLTNVTT